jgi:hypothetical protein
MAIFTGYTGYGGATITREIDYTKHVFIGCCAVKGDDKTTFGFHIFRDDIEVPYWNNTAIPFCTGRGSINADGTWIAWRGNEHFEGLIPQFVIRPTLTARYVAALERLCKLLGI